MAKRNKDVVEQEQRANLKSKRSVKYGVVALHDALRAQFTGAAKLAILVALAEEITEKEPKCKDHAAIVEGARIGVQALQDGGCSNATLNKADAIFDSLELSFGGTAPVDEEPEEEEEEEVEEEVDEEEEETDGDDDGDSDDGDDSDEGDEEEDDGLEDMTVAQLTDLAAERSVELPSKPRKAEIVEALRAAE